MKLNWLWILAIIGAQLGTIARADNAISDPATDSKLDALKKEIQALAQKVDLLEQQKTQAQLSPQLDELDQHVRILERKQEIAEENVAATTKTAPRVSVGSSGLSVSSADTNFVFSLKGLVQVDNRSFFNSNPKLHGNDTFLLRRARPIFQGTLYHDFDFVLVPDFA